MNASTRGSAARPQAVPEGAARPLRFVSAASLFDGHDAAINMIRRLLQAHGAEVVHLGHNRSVADIVRAAIQEDADAIAVSSYQGGHNEYFAYMVDMLRERGCEHIRVIVGGGGTISPRGDRGAGAPRRREDLHARGRPATRPERHDRGCVRPGAARMPGRLTSCARSTHATPRTWAERSPCSRETPPGRPRRSRSARRSGAPAHSGARHRHHRHRRRRQIEPDR